MSYKIGVIDSGLGGIVVLKKLLFSFPNLEYFYHFDNLNSPYGNKSLEELEIISCTAINTLINKGCNIIIIACNTIGTNLYDKLLTIYKDITILSIFPNIDNIYSIDSNQTVLLLATYNTINSNKIKNYYTKYENTNFKFITYALPNLVYLIENNKQEDIKIYLEEELTKYKNKIDTVILGCTHYPLVKNEIQKIILNTNFNDGIDNLMNELNKIIKYVNNIQSINYIFTKPHDERMLFFKTKIEEILK